MIVKTRNTSYTVEHLSNNAYTISGHSRYCPEPVIVYMSPPTVGHSMRFTYLDGAMSGETVTTTTVRSIDHG